MSSNVDFTLDCVKSQQPKEIHRSFCSFYWRLVSTIQFRKQTTHAFEFCYSLCSFQRLLSTSLFICFVYLLSIYEKLKTFTDTEIGPIKLKYLGSFIIIDSDFVLAFQMFFFPYRFNDEEIRKGEREREKKGL